MTDLGKRLLDHLPPKINREGEIISSLIANEDGSGALEKLFAYSALVKKTYSDTKDVYEMDGDLLDQVMAMFSFLGAFIQKVTLVL